MIMRRLKSVIMTAALVGCFAMTSLSAGTDHVKAAQTEQIVASIGKESNTPAISLDKTYVVAADDYSGRGDADIIAWSSNRWNGFEYVKFKSTGTVTLIAKELGDSSSWFKIWNEEGEAVTDEYCVGKRSNCFSLSEKLALKPGTYYLGLQPHAKMSVRLESDVTISTSESKIELGVGDTTQIDAVLKKGSKVVDNAKFTYKSSNSLVAKVSSYGKVVAVNPGSCKITIVSNKVEKKITVVVDPKKVSGIKKVSATKNSVKLSWKAQKGISGYEVWMYDKDFDEYTKVKNVSKDFSSATITELKKKTTYKFKVRGYVKCGSKKYYGDYSNVFMVKTK